MHMIFFSILIVLRNFWLVKICFCSGRFQRKVLLAFGSHWVDVGSAPSRPLAVVKRLMGEEPSVMRVDLRPRACNISAWAT